MQSTTVKPVSTTQRIAYLDILRGIAILFIYTANIVVFSGLMFFPEDYPHKIYTLPTDEMLRFICYVLIDGKFYSIFSLLFGIGCVIQYNNLTAKGKAFAPFFRTRMFWLLVFGLIHLVFFWPGDILTLYALLGFFLIGFVKKSNRTLLTTAVILLLVPILNVVFMNVTGFFYPGLAFQKSTEIYQYFGMPVTENQGVVMLDFVAYQLNENIGDFFKMNVGNAFFRVGMILEEGRIFKVFGIFLIGIWAGRKILNNAILDNTRFLKKVFVIGLLVGLPINIVRGYLEFYSHNLDSSKLFHTIAYALGTVPLALGYAAGIALLVKKNIGSLNWFKPVGKTALSNYLFQTAISIIIFYGIGFNLVGKLGFTYVILICIVVFSFQIIGSKLWLHYFKFGPMEWLWRKLTYGFNINLKQ